MRVACNWVAGAVRVGCRSRENVLLGDARGMCMGMLRSGMALFSKCGAEFWAACGLSFLFAAFARSLVGTATFQSSLETVFLCASCLLLALGLFLYSTRSCAAEWHLALCIAIGAFLDSIVALFIGRASTVCVTLAFLVMGLCGMGGFCFLSRSGFTGTSRDGERVSPSYRVLAFPVGYFLAFVAVLGCVFGCVFMVHVGGLNRGLAQLGFFIGCVLSGVVTVGLNFLAKDCYLEVLAKATLLFLVFGLSLVLITQQSFISLLVLAIGFCCFLALVLLLVFDYYRAFAFPLVFPAAFLFLLFGSLLAGLFVGRLLLLSGSIDSVDAFTMYAMVLINAVTVFGLGSNHKWSAAYLADSAKGEGDARYAAAPVHSFWDEAVSDVAAEAGLTKRETEVLALLARGRDAAYIEEHLVVSNHTARAHILNIYKKTDLHSRQALIDIVEERAQEKEREHY